MIAKYDLRYRSASFDFFGWLLYVQAKGATEISLRFGVPDRKVIWSTKDIRKRYETIIRPGAALAGLPCYEGEEGEDFGQNKLFRLVEVLQVLRPGWRRLQSVSPPASKRYTVTLRNTVKQPIRNSDVRLWRQFADKIGAHVIEDYDIKPLSLHERMALYAGAEMNFGVCTGPMAILFFTPYPVTMFNCQVDPGAWRKHGVVEGRNHPLALPHQRLVWEEPTIYNLMREFEQRCTAKKEKPVPRPKLSPPGPPGIISAAIQPVEPLEAHARPLISPAHRKE